MLGLLCCLVTIIWCSAYNRWTLEAWSVPVIYGSDGWAEMATAKAFAYGGVRPVLPKYPASLGAPFQANWNDHVTVEEPMFSWYGLLVRAFGVFFGSNLSLLTAHLLAVAGFYPVARTMGAHQTFAGVFAVLFSVSFFAFVRSLEHLVLTYYWHIPLGLLVVWWCLDGGPWSSRRVLAAIAIGLLHGVQNPYYTYIFVQLLGLTAIVALVRRRPAKEIVLPLSIGAAGLAAFALMNVDTVTYWLRHGPNALATVRSYAGVELYALKPLELLLPAIHRLSWIAEWTNDAYFGRAMFLGERGSPYLGIAAIAGLCWIGWEAVKGISRQSAVIPRHFWIILWIVLYSAVGGGNGLVACFGLVLFRASNRFSIIIMATALLFLAVQISARPLARRLLFQWGAALAILAVGVWDQVLRWEGYKSLSEIRDTVLGDKRFVEQMEARLPRGAKVFQLPVVDYPEAAPVGNMADYEHFRPYLHSHFLDYSYGSDKGRARERWQGEAAQLGPAALVTILEQYGFSALFLNKKAYPDGGADLLKALRSAGAGTTIAESVDLICLSLNPSPRPSFPPEFDWQWYGVEGTFPSGNWRWSQGNASIILHRGNTGPATVRVIFKLAVVGPRRLVIRQHSRELYNSFFAAGDPSVMIDLPVVLSQEATELRFETDRPGELPASGDPRRLSFNVADFKIVE
jgi:phosphoglycerol transferase